MSTHPISKVCPLCGGGNYSPQKPEGIIAFANDRVCSSCNTVYTPPTPVWAGVVFVLIGLPFAAGGAFGVIAPLARVGIPVDIFWMAVFVSMGLLGLTAIVHGIRAIIRPGRA